MITTADIGNILYKDCQQFALPVYRRIVSLKKDGVTKDIITFHVRRQVTGKRWDKTYVDVNLCVPDLDTDVDNTIRLAELEREAKRLFKSVTGVYDGTRYVYSTDSVGTEADTALKCHYVNIKLLFEVLNTL